MEFIKDIKKSTIIITEKNLKQEIIKYISKQDKLIDIKVITIKEFIKEFCFDYNEKTIFYIMKQYNINYDIALIYLKNLYYIENKNYNSNKLNKLKEIKKDLINNNLLIFNNNYKEYINDKNIITYNLEYKNRFEENTLKEINVKEIYDKNNNYEHEVYCFNDIKDEVMYVANTIGDLLTKNVNINNIKLTNIDSEYELYIRRIFKFYNINIEEEKKSLYSFDMTKDYLKYFDKDITKTIEIIKEKYHITTENKIFNKLIDITNKYIWCENYLEVKELIKEELKNTKIVLNELKDKVTIIDYKTDYINDNDYVFMMNFNQESIPVLKKDEDYITDNLLNEINLENTIEKNKKEKEITIRNIKNIKNLIITYKNKTLTKTSYPSYLIKDLNLKVKKIELDNKVSYSKTLDKIILTKYLDNFIKYGNKDNNLDLLYSNNQDINYLTYDNSYKKIDKTSLEEYLNNNLYLSYTSLDNYYKCSFKYYLNNILKLNKYEETFATLIGNIFHYVLQIGLEKDIDTKEETINYLKEHNIILNNKEKFFFNKLTKDLDFIKNSIKEQMKYIKLDNSKYEEKIIINKDKNIKITFTGIIDKILYKEENNKTYIALIDYKTGNIDLDLKYIEEGLQLQLPTYLYLIKESNMFINPVFCGFYLQKILKDTTEEEKIKSIKLQGYSNFEEDIIKKFDISYKDSEIISGLKVKNDGNFYSTAKILSNDEINKIIDITNNKINEATNNILDANFDINPKKVKYGSNIGCKYCSMNDICYKKNKDIKEIEEKKDLSFLGGDINA